jgi:hypothetical protein
MEGDRSATQMLRRNAGAEQSREDPLRDSHDTSSLAATQQSPVGQTPRTARHEPLHKPGYRPYETPVTRLDSPASRGPEPCAYVACRPSDTALNPLASEPVGVRF